MIFGKNVVVFVARQGRPLVIRGRNFRSRIQPFPRITRHGFAEQAVAYGLSDIEELQSIARAFVNWAGSPDGVFVVPHVEILARR